MHSTITSRKAKAVRTNGTTTPSYTPDTIRDRVQLARDLSIPDAGADGSEAIPNITVAWGPADCHSLQDDEHVDCFHAHVEMADHRTTITPTDRAGAANRLADWLEQCAGECHADASYLERMAAHFRKLAE